MAEFVERPKEVIKTRVGDVDVNIDYDRFFGNLHDPHRARMTTESLWRQVTHGQTIKAEHQNPLGHREVANYEVPATWAIGHALETLSENTPLPGKDPSQQMIVTSIRHNGKRLVTERATVGETHKLAIHWIPETQAQQFIDAEVKHDQLTREGKVYRPKPSE